MSQPRNPTDTQALLQSMLQRLKLQPGREGQAYQHSPVPVTAAPTWGQDLQSGASSFQRVNNSPVNGFEFGTNGIPSKEFGISAADSNFNLKGGEIEQSDHGSEVDRGLVSLPTQKVNIDGDMGEHRVLGQPGLTPTGTGELFPAKSLKDADILSVQGADQERVSFGSPAMTKHTPSDKDDGASMGQNQDQDQSFTPKVYMWSLKPTDVDTGSQEDKVLHVGNGGFRAFIQSKDMQIVPNNTMNSSFRRKQRPSEKKTRWTQKIKEKWRDRPGSFGKKGKEEEGREQRSEQGTENSSQNQLLEAETCINTSNKEEERTLLSQHSSDPSNIPDGFMRSAGDFEFGLGSFSLLEEIITGQEWAKFLNPNLSATSANQRPSEELKIPIPIPTNPRDSSQSTVILNHAGGVNNHWSLRSPDTSPTSDFSLAQISPDTLQPVSMDVSGGIQRQYVHREADQSEPMEHGHFQSDMQSGENRIGQKPRSLTSPADILNKPTFKSRVSLNRKRQHQSAESRDEKLQSDANREGSGSSRSQAGEMGESQHDSINSPPPPLSPYSFTPFAKPPKGVLKHSMSQDSESSMETVTKRRRVEENRRVHFSEELVTIVPPQLDLDDTDSEEDSDGEDSVIEQECEGEQAGMEEVAAARWRALPAWIQALKRRSTGKKHR